VSLCPSERVGKKQSGGAGTAETAAAGHLLPLNDSSPAILLHTCSTLLGQQVFHRFDGLRIDQGCSECLAGIHIIQHIGNARMSPKCLEPSFPALQSQRRWRDAGHPRVTFLVNSAEIMCLGY